MNKMKIKTLTVAMGLISTLTATPTVAAVNNYDWNGVFRFVDDIGIALLNTSLPAKGSNRFDTPVSGTMAFDTITGAGTVTMMPFDWGDNPVEAPFEATSFNLQAIGDGAGGPGTLMLGNLLFSWNFNTGMPVSIVLDAQGFFAGDLDGSAGLGATPATDGTYVGEFVTDTVNGPGGYPGYMGLGPIPMATTAWNTTNNCEPGECLGNAVSGVLPLLFDTAENRDDYTANTGGSIAGSPILDGPFATSNFSLDFTDLTFISTNLDATIAPFCEFEGSTYGSFPGCPVPTVPVPAAIWLFGSGMLALLGFARVRKAEY